MSNRRRALAALAVIAMVALISACGSSTPGGTGTGTGTGSAQAAPAGTGSASSTASKRERGVRFAECMRTNGVPDFPDPNPSGDFVYGASVTPTVFTQAVNACKALQPPGTLSATRSPAQQSAGIKFAQCVRGNGVKDFPDPVNGQPLINTYRIPSSNLPGGMSILNAAIQKCRPFLAAAARGQ